MFIAFLNQVNSVISSYILKPLLSTKMLNQLQLLFEKNNKANTYITNLGDTFRAMK
jgi:hypothetical protein